MKWGEEPPTHPETPTGRGLKCPHDLVEWLRERRVFKVCFDRLDEQVAVRIWFDDKPTEPVSFETRSLATFLERLERRG